MQPRVLLIVLIILSALATNGAYLISAYEGFVPWCVPYIDGCTTISRAARSGSALFIFRAAMIAYAVLLIAFWIYSKHWLLLLHGYVTKTSRVILWLGILGAITLIVYIDFLGTAGEVNRFMRRYGIMIYFTFTPLAQLLMLSQHYDVVRKTSRVRINHKALRFQLVILVLMLITGVISIILNIAEYKTYETENIVEWNFSLLMTLYFVGMVFVWENYQHNFIIRPKNPGSEN